MGYLCEEIQHITEILKKNRSLSSAEVFMSYIHTLFSVFDQDQKISSLEKIFSIQLHSYFPLFVTLWESF